TDFEEYFWPWLVNTFFNSIQNCHGLLLGDWSGFIRCTAYKTKYSRDIPNHMPSLISQLHLNQHITGEKLTFAFALLPHAHLNYFLSWNQDFPKVLTKTVSFNPFFQGFFHFVFKVRVSMYHIP